MSMNGIRPSPCGSKGARQDHRVPVTDDFWPLFRQYVQTERAHGRRLGRSTSRPRRAVVVRGLRVGAAVDRAKGRRDGARASVSAHRRSRGPRDLRQSEGHAGTPRPRAPVTTADLYLTIDPRALVDAVAAVKVRSDAAHAHSHPPAEAGRESYTFAYNAVTIEELERAVTARRSPTGARP